MRAPDLLKDTVRPCVESAMLKISGNQKISPQPNKIYRII